MIIMKTPRHDQKSTKRSAYVEDSEEFHDCVPDPLF